MDTDKIKKQAEELWDGVKKVAEKTKGELGKVTKISQLKIDQTRQKYDRGNLLKELGEAVYQLVRSGEKEIDASVADIVEQIEQIDKKIADETEEIKNIKGKNEGGTKAASQKGKGKKKGAKKAKEAKVESEEDEGL